MFILFVTYKHDAATYLPLHPQLRLRLLLVLTSLYIWKGWGMTELSPPLDPPQTLTAKRAHLKERYQHSLNTCFNGPHTLLIHMCIMVNDLVVRATKYWCQFLWQFVFTCKSLQLWASPFWPSPRLCPWTLLGHRPQTLNVDSCSLARHESRTNANYAGMVIYVSYTWPWTNAIYPFTSPQL